MLYFDHIESTYSGTDMQLGIADYHGSDVIMYCVNTYIHNIMLVLVLVVRMVLFLSLFLPAVA